MLTPKKPMTALSLFSGIGSMDLAAVDGFEGQLNIVAQCEIDGWKRGVLQKHAPRYWPNARILTDVIAVDGKDYEGIDLIYGGFPCTNISASGNGLGLQGADSRLWYEMWRVIRDARPRAIVVENVPTITARGGTTVVAQLATLGYRSCWYVVPAHAFGYPLFRERWVYVAIADGHGIEVPRKQYQEPDRESSVKWDVSLGKAKRGNRAGSVSGTSPASRKRVGQSELEFVRTESPMVRSADGVASGLDRLQSIPAGSWQAQGADEPPRLTPKTKDTTKQLQAIGDCALPQQLVPAFSAVYRILREIDHANAE